MSNSISSSTSGTLAGALLNLGTKPAGTPSAPDGGADGVDLDNLQLSNSSLSELEQQAQQVAAQNQDSVISTSDEALAVNLQAVSALGQNFTQTTAAQGGLDAATVLSLTQ